MSGSLLLMRGVPNCGKSTWIKDNNLSLYTLEADEFRLLLSNPKTDEDGRLYISQEYNHIAWGMLYKCLENRMSNGDFTVIDATHTTTKSMNSYKKLADKYNYNVYIKELNVNLDELHNRNSSREEYKRVPSYVIDNMYENLTNSSIPEWITIINSIEDIPVQEIR